MHQMRSLDHIIQKLWLRNTKKIMLFNACDLGLDPMTLILELDLDTIVTYLYTKNEVNRSKSSKVMVWKHRQTDTQTHRQTHRETHRQTDRQTCVKPLPTRSRGR